MAKLISEELRATMREADELSKKDMTKQDRDRHTFLLAKMAALRGVDDESSKVSLRWFRDLTSGKEVRGTTLEAGTQSLTSTAGAKGGYLVPIEFHDEVIFGMAQFDPLLDADVVTLIQSKGGDLAPYTIPGWDLSTFQAVKVSEANQQNSQTTPTVAVAQLNGYKYMASLGLTMELEEDAFEPMKNRMQEAFSIGMARGIGVDLILGNGTTAPQGVLTGAAPSGVVSATPGVLVGDDIEDIYFSVNRFHRAQPKCAWMMNDTLYQAVRKMKDTANRPLLEIRKDKEMLLGKPVYVSPSLSSGGQSILFGDFSHYFVRVSRLVINRQWQLPGYVEYGKALYTGIMRADAIVFDPSGGSTPPIVYGGLHS